MHDETGESSMVLASAAVRNHRHVLARVFMQSVFCALAEHGSHVAVVQPELDVLRITFLG